MLKLLRTANSRTNAPEIERIPKANFRFDVAEGMAIEKEETTWEGAAYYPYYIVAKTPENNDKYVYCYKVNTDMIFITQCINCEGYKVGDYVAIYTTNLFPEYVTLDADGPGRIIETVPGTKYVYVKFDRRREYEAW